MDLRKCIGKGLSDRNLRGKKEPSKSVGIERCKDEETFFNKTTLAKSINRTRL